MVWTTGSTTEVAAQPAVSPAAVYIASLAPGSRRTMAGALDAIASLVGGDGATAGMFPWHLVRHAHSAAVRSALAERHAPATANKMLSALRGCLKAAWRLGLMSGEDYHRAADVPPVRGETLPRGRGLAAGELDALFRDCSADPSPGGRRDAALLAVLYGAGLRRAEAVGLDADDWNPAAGTLRVRGKGRKEREAFVADGGRQAVTAWLAIRGVGPGPLFLPVNKSGRIAWRRITEQAVYVALRKRADRAGLAPLSPHDLRRSFVSDLLDRGADLSVVRKLAGHSNVATTARYDRRPADACRRAAELLRVPAANGGTATYVTHAG